MTELVLRLEANSGAAQCGLCQGDMLLAGGLHLSLDVAGDPVCGACGKQHAPALAALVELARAAEHVGRIGRHTVSPPLTALLDLARAAEDFATALPERRLEAA